MTEEQKRALEQAAAALARLSPAGLRIGFVLGILQLALPEIDAAEMQGLIVDLRRACTKYLWGGDLSV